MMISISLDVRKAQQSCFLANVKKKKKKKVFNSPFRKTGFRHVADEEWGKNKKKTPSRKSVKSKWWLFFIQL